VLLLQAEAATSVTAHKTAAVRCTDILRRGGRNLGFWPVLRADGPRHLLEGQPFTEFSASGRLFEEFFAVL
jgi:hypothetical protein